MDYAHPAIVEALKLGAERIAERESFSEQILRALRDAKEEVREELHTAYYTLTLS